ncbi:hypothetical protein HY504_00620 [Candidatus Wolfebacteria bacterium]|nr:hypothetical protein [Candidatus Wolfebacteria bacterium]
MRVAYWAVANWRSMTTSGILADVAPTILEIMNIKKPKEMTGESLLDSLR